jgi:hypothetical protein
MTFLKVLTEFSTTIQIREAEAPGTLFHLPAICGQKLQNVVARDLKVTNRLVTFHGGSSTTAKSRERWVTNWNLLSPIEYGEIWIDADPFSPSLSYRIEYKRLMMFATLGAFLLALLVGSFLLYASGEWLNSFTRFLFVFLAAWFWLGLINVLVLNVRFYLFIRNCIHRAKSAAKNSLPLPDYERLSQ